MTKPKPLSWTPVRHGETYCSLACGAGCKLADYLQANKDGVVLANSLGKGWKVTVSENFGWKYSVTKGAVTVYHRSDDYWAGFMVSGQYFSGTGKTAKAAVRSSIEVGLKLAEAIKRAVVKI